MQLRPYFLIFFSFLVFKITAQSTASQHVATFTIEVPELEAQKKIWVYLPASYENTQKAYSVIYMHDAQNLFDDTTSFVGEWQIDEYLDSIGNNETIIIGIEHGNEKRLDELTPYPHEKYGGGKGDLYLDFIKNTLKPNIDSKYKTLPGAEHTTIMGSSLGGLISFYAGIQYPETFGNVGVLSPSFWLNEEIYKLVEKADIPETSRFYFLAGSIESEEMIPDMEKMIVLLQRKGVNPENIKSTIIEGGQHNEALWRENFPLVYEWLIMD